MRSDKELLIAIAERAYLVDPEATDADLVELGQHELATSLRHDHRMGRIAEHHANMTGRRVVVERVEAAPGHSMVAGALLSPSEKSRE